MTRRDLALLALIPTIYLAACCGVHALDAGPGKIAKMGAPMGRTAHWGEEEERSGADAGRKTGGAERSFFRRRPAMRPIRA